MKIIDYSTQDLNSKSQIFWQSQISLRKTNFKFQIIEIVAASLIFIIPVLALFILAK